MPSCQCRDWRISSYSYTLKSVGYLTPCVLGFAFPFLFILGCCKKEWFYVEPRQHNPYHVVLKVLNFARKNKYPLRRSAFTYCDDERPSRIDFAKERYGGPFTTEQVENVKTFLRILLLLLAVGPVFVLEVPSLLYLLFGLHIGRSRLTLGIWFVESSGLKYIIGVILFPLYVWFIFSRRTIPKIFTRLLIGIFAYFLGVLSMLIIDIVGHVKSLGEGTVVCIFNVTNGNYNSLNMHWAVLIPSSVLLGLSSLIVVATTIEFISAQSPNSMKGLLIGVFYAIKGVFQALSSIIFLAFSIPSVWSSHLTTEHPPFTSCGFGYLLLMCVIALIGLILLSVVARRYKYRERDDRPYDQRFAVDVYSRYLE